MRRAYAEEEHLTSSNVYVFTLLEEMEIHNEITNGIHKCEAMLSRVK